MSIVHQIRSCTAKALENLYGLDVKDGDLTVNSTNPEFEGDYTLVLFSLVRLVKKSPGQTGTDIGNYLCAHHPDIFKNYTIIKGFLNLGIAEAYWINFLQANFSIRQFGTRPPNGTRVIVEYSSPNTNKPLHLGHLRNIFLGWSVAQILEANGFDVVKTCVVNDRGIHICKSMLAWQLFANGETPADVHKKGDHFVGDYYVKFDEEFKKQVGHLVEKGVSRDEAEKGAPIMKAAQQMLLDWEAGKPDVIELWKRMNGWVYEGFDTTYRRIGADFTKIYYESDTYLLGKKTVDEGLQENVFFRKDDGSVWIDLAKEALDEKLVLRRDGTSVYITQDLGLAEEKYADFKYDQSIYVVGDEQNHYLKVLKLILQKLGKPYAEGIYHLSYGMVELPTGRMKSREGTVVDADDLVDEMIGVAATHTEALGKVADFTEAGLQELYDTIGLGALKFYLLRVDPKKRMVFNPEESIDFHGFTGPFIQYTHARIKSILRRERADPTYRPQPGDLLPVEKGLIILLEQFPAILEQAALEHNPSVIAIYVFTLAKAYNAFYAEYSVVNADSADKKQLRLQISEMMANVISFGMHLLGIKVPERM